MSYQSPSVLSMFFVEMETSILAGSVAEKTTVKSTGQKVEEYDFSQSSFNQVWE